eukprot:1853458-Amphidinium_carterae.1
MKTKNTCFLIRSRGTDVTKRQGRATRLELVTTRPVFQPLPDPIEDSRILRGGGAIGMYDIISVGIGQGQMQQPFTGNSWFACIACSLQPELEGV